MLWAEGVVVPPPRCTPPRTPAPNLLHSLAPTTLHSLQVRREAVVEDALNQLVFRPLEDLKKPLRVTFISNGVAEPAQDEGGVTKE